PLRDAHALPRVRPTGLPSGPRGYEKVHGAVMQGLEESHGAKRRVGEWALRIGYEVSALRQAGKPVPAALAVKHRIADKLVYSKVKARLGGRLRADISGGWALAREMPEFFLG